MSSRRAAPLSGARRSANDLECKLWRAALLDESRDLVPVDERRYRVGDKGRDPEPRQLFDAPPVDEHVVVGRLELDVEFFNHLAGRMTAVALHGIGATGDLQPPTSRRLFLAGSPTARCVEVDGSRKIHPPDGRRAKMGAVRADTDAGVGDHRRHGEVTPDEALAPRRGSRCRHYGTTSRASSD